MPTSHPKPPATLEKALRLNLDRSIYGTFAEIGAGQEIANWFFNAGGASGTVAKTMSAYDMTMSDEIYGHTRRYVSRQRLEAMLQHEYSILEERLSPSRGDQTRFFALASTIRARGYQDMGSECHGWMGVRFQTTPEESPSEVLIHFRLLDDTNREQADTAGILGVNLLWAVHYCRENRAKLLNSLMDRLTRWRIEIDMVKFTGIAFDPTEFDDRLVALQLVECDLTDAALFGADGEIFQPSERLYKRPVVISRGSFDPITKINLDMLDRTRERFISDFGHGVDDHVEILEITMNNLTHREGGVSPQDFLARVSVLQSLGKNVLISKYPEFHRLSGYLARHTQMPIGIALGLPLFEELFDPKWSQDLPGGVLEACGRLFRNQVRLYIYPCAGGPGQPIRTLHNANTEGPQKRLLQYLVETLHVRPIMEGLEDYLSYSNSDIRQMIEQNDPQWENMVPSAVLQSGYWSQTKCLEA